MTNSDYFPFGLLLSRAGWTRFQVAEILADDILKACEYFETHGGYETPPPVPKGEKQHIHC